MSSLAVSSKELIPTPEWTASFNAAVDAQATNPREAVRLFRECARLDPLLWVTVADQDRREGRKMEALHKFIDALEFAKDPKTQAAALANIGLIYLLIGELELAERYTRESVKAWKTTVGLLNLGTVIGFARSRVESIKYHDEALRINPRFADAAFAKSFGLIENGDWLKGWQEYESRFASVEHHAKRLPTGLPEWIDCKPHPGKHLLVYFEQGCGDTLCMFRFLPLLKSRFGFAKLSFVPQGPLKRLMELQGVADNILQDGDPMPDGLDMQCAMMSLPFLFRVTPDTLPPAPILKGVEPNNLGDGFKVGLAWRGSPEHIQDWSRSMRLDNLLPLLDVPGVRFFSLQLGLGANDVGALGLGQMLPKLLEPGMDYLDSARAVKALDLVISVDTSIVHLAASLGVPVWMMSAPIGDFRWGLKDRTPWYSDFRIYRGTVPKKWGDVVQAIAEDLSNHAQPCIPESAGKSVE